MYLTGATTCNRIMDVRRESENWMLNLATLKHLPKWKIVDADH